MVDVRFARKLVGILLLGVLFGYPAMACLSQTASEMSEAERECCQHMSQQCGSMDMPASHSCCQTEVRQPNSMLHVASTHLTPPIGTEAAVVQLTTPHTMQVEFAFFQLHPPPEGPPGSSSILRI